MSENLHNIDKLFRDGIEGQEEMPPPGIWNELDKKLDKKKVDSISGKYYKLKWVAAALFIFSFGMGMYVYHVHKNAEVVKNSGSREPASETGTGIKHADATIKSTDITAESGKNILYEKPAARPVEPDSLQSKNLPAVAPPVVQRELPGNAAPVANEHAKLQHEAASKDFQPSSAAAGRNFFTQNNRRVQKSDAIGIKSVPEENAAAGKQSSRQLDIAGNANNQSGSKGRQKKSGRQDLAQSAEHTNENQTGSGSPSALHDLHTAFLPYDLPGLLHPEVMVFTSFSKLAGPAPLPGLPSGNASGFVKLHKP